MAADKFADAQKLLTRSGPFATADFDKDYPVRTYSHPLCAGRGHLELTGTWNFAIGTRTTPAHTHLTTWNAQHSKQPHFTCSLRLHCGRVGMFGRSTRLTARAHCPQTGCARTRHPLRRGRALTQQHIQRPFLHLTFRAKCGARDELRASV
jgi:hypothetical protein